MKVMKTSKRTLIGSALILFIADIFLRVRHLLRVDRQVGKGIMGGYATTTTKNQRECCLSCSESGQRSAEDLQDSGGFCGV